MAFQTRLNLPTILESERLTLRRYETADAQWYAPMCQRNRDHLAVYEAHNPARNVNSVNDAETLLGDFQSEWTMRRHFYMGAFEKTSNTFVAQIYIGPVNWEIPEFEIGYFADFAYQGNGYVTEAVKAILAMLFGPLKVRRVMIRCDDTNSRSSGVAERCGFMREGHLRQNHILPDGTITGTFYYGMLRDEFTRTKSS